MTTIEKHDTTTPALPAASGLERALGSAAVKLFAKRHGEHVTPVDLEALADRIIRAAIIEQHDDVLGSADDPTRPTAQEHRWALSLAGAVATRFQRTARSVLRGLKAQQQKADAQPTRNTTPDDGCAPWCIRHGSPNGCDWCESEPIALSGPGDHYAEVPEQYEVMWACLSEAPDDELRAGASADPYIYFDTLSTGQGDRLDVAAVDELLGNLTGYVARLQAMRDRLAELTETP